MSVEYKMLALIELGLRRELQAILSLYLGPLLSGYTLGFSAVAGPDIREELRCEMFSDQMEFSKRLS